MSGTVMECINALADGELAVAEREEWLSRIEECDDYRAAYEEVLQLKRLVADLPPAPIPADLRRRVRDRLRPVITLGRLRFLAAAAALVCLAAGLAIVYQGSSPLIANAQVIRKCFELYDRDCYELDGALHEIGPAAECLDRMRADILRLTGRDLRELPILENACYCGSVTSRAGPEGSVRIDFWPHATSGCAEPHMVSIFVVPLDQLADKASLRESQARNGGKYAILHCGRGTGNSILSLVGEDHVYNVVTRLRADELCEKLDPALRRI